MQVVIQKFAYTYVIHIQHTGTFGVTHAQAQALFLSTEECSSAWFN